MRHFNVAVSGILMMLGISFAANATAQAPDKLIYEGKEYSIQTNPVEIYFEQHPEARAISEVMSTGLWRGYIATMEIKDKRLLVKDIQIEVVKKDSKNRETEFVSAMATSFPDQKEVVATWFTGYLIVPTGKRTTYVHMGYGSTFSDYLLFQIEAGAVKSERKLDEKAFVEFRNAQWEAFKKTKEYADIVKEIKEPKDPKMAVEMDDKMMEGFISSYYAAKYMSIIFSEEAKSK